MPTRCVGSDITKRVVFQREGKNTVSPDFGVLTWNHPIVHNQVLRRAKTSNGTLKINNRDVNQIVMPVPPPDEQRSVVEVASAAETTIDALSSKLQAYEGLKRSLMDSLLNGRMRVNDVRRTPAGTHE
jgi:type I restriction enzyme S subunit